MRDAAQHATADSMASAGATPGADLDGTRMPGTAMRDFLAGTPSAACSTGPGTALDARASWHSSTPSSAGQPGVYGDGARRLWAIRPGEGARGQRGDGHEGNKLIEPLRPLPEGWRVHLKPWGRVRFAARRLWAVALLAHTLG